ncbi:Protein of unknown function DUF4817 [Trinorchestia longiramus]|nr:Protein of unknown function DUF4817 [Trinorchestia longiramus]
MQLTKEQRIFIILEYETTKNCEQVRRAFNETFPERNSPDKKTVYRTIVEESGWGWDLFTMTTSESASQAANSTGADDIYSDTDDTKTVSDILSAYDRDLSVYTRDNFQRLAELDDQLSKETSVRPGRGHLPTVQGKLFAAKTLDYENGTHRRGFRFLVRVTDKGPGGWADPRHVAQTWVHIVLTDVNDNPPQFERHQAFVTVKEDVAPGTLLVSMPAHDDDENYEKNSYVQRLQIPYENFICWQIKVCTKKNHKPPPSQIAALKVGIQKIDYYLDAKWDGSLYVDQSGTVRVVSHLDREAEHVSSNGVTTIKVIVVDRGVPPLSSTATVTLTLKDVNDCPPDVVVGVVRATDRDVWALGHGPPFNFSLAPNNPPHLLQLIQLKLMPSGGPLDHPVKNSELDPLAHTIFRFTHLAIKP